MALLAATALAALVVAPGVTAGKPVKFPILNEPLSLEGICDFRLDGEPVGPQRQKGFEFEDGRIVFNGQLTVRVWNADDPSKALETTASGPVFLLPNPDGTLTVKGTGVNIWFFFPGDLGPGERGAVFLVKGLSTELIDAEGNLVPGSFEHEGYIENLCTTLA
jgi:hypothetical protein